MNRKAIIFGIKGKKLKLEEKVLIKKIKPWGIILFSRNIKNINQLKVLIKSIRKTFNDRHYPILIDEEGGSVSRLKKILNFDFPSQSYFAKIYKKDKKNFFKAYDFYINKICEVLHKVGININTVPVLDVRRNNSHKIIYNRSFSSNQKTVSILGTMCENLFKKNKIITIAKHIPGHGPSKLDSHTSLPIIINKKKELIKKDFMPFKKTKSLLAMTAHLIYKEYDPIYVATHSKIIITKVIRKTIGFKGILVSDDISMKALKYGLKRNALMALSAGCNIILHCNGNIKEMKELAKIVPKIDKFTEKKTSDLYKFLR